MAQSRKCLDPREPASPSSHVSLGCKAGEREFFSPCPRPPSVCCGHCYCTGLYQDSMKDAPHPRPVLARSEQTWWSGGRKPWKEGGAAHGSCPARCQGRCMSGPLFGPRCSGYIVTQLPRPTPTHILPRLKLGRNQENLTILLSTCAWTPVSQNYTPKDGEMRGSEMDRQTTGRGFTAEPGSLLFSQRDPLGTIDAQLTKAMPFLLARHSCSDSGRSVMSVDRLDPLGEGASTDPRLASCSLEVQWGRGGLQTDKGCTLHPALGVCSPSQVWKAPHQALQLNSSLASLPSSFAKIRTLKEISSMLDPGHLGLSSPSVPGDLAAAHVSRVMSCLMKTVRPARLFHMAFRSGAPGVGVSLFV